MGLGPFGSHEVAECGVRITNAGDGLSESLEADPVELDLDDITYLVLKGTVAKVTYERIRDSDELRRVHVIRTTFGTIVDERTARKILDATRRKVEDHAGVTRLAGIASDDDS